MARGRSCCRVWVFCAGAIALHGLVANAAEPGRVTPCVILDLSASYTYPSLEPKVLESKTTSRQGGVTQLTVVPKAPPPIASTEKQAASKQATAPADQAKTPVQNLFDAIDRGDLRGVERLLGTRSMDPRDLRDEQGNWAITIAAQKGLPEISRALIRYGVPLRTDKDTVKGGGDLTPVLEATGSLAALLSIKDKKDSSWTRLGATPARYLEIIELLLEAGGDSNEVSHRFQYNDPSRTPLRTLIESAPSSAEVVQAARLLLLHGALISVGGQDLLANAAMLGKNELIAEILRQRHPPQESLDEAYSEALRLDQLTAAQMLVAAGANVNARGNAQQSVLWRAMVPTLNRERVEFLLAQGADVNDVPPGYKTPLVMALYDDSLMRAIIKHGANVNARDASGKTALRLALEPPANVSREIGDQTPITTKYPGLDRGNRKRAVQLLLESGADPNVADNFGVTPLMVVGPSEPDLLELFLEHGAAVNLSGSDMVEYHRGGIDVGPVTWAVLHGNEPLALRFLNRAGRIDRPDCGVVYYAAARGDATLLTDLRKFGANVNVTESRDNYSPLMAAVLSGGSPTVKVLLADSRIDVNYRTPVRRIEIKNPYSGQPMAVVDEGGVSALWLAAKAGNADVVSLLLGRGANVNVTESRDNYTPLMAATAKGSIPTLSVLLADRRIDVNYRTPVRRTEFKDPVSGLPVIVVDGGRTALMLAVQQEAAYPGIVSLLLEHGADAHQTDAKGQSPIDYARGGPPATLDLLRKAVGRQSP
jgi:ankyrin repeat protein